MATQEKLLKSLNALRNLMNSNLTSDQNVRKKEKIQHCNIITEAISNPTIKIATNFNQLLAITMEVFLQLCDDQESDIRMMADECLNRIIRAMSNGNIGKVQIELHKEIKKNGPARSLRAALWRFSQLAHLIKPHKGKPYVVNLMPCIIKISERSEEQVHETLANSLPKIMASLGCFTTDNEIKGLIKAFLNNIPNTSVVIRRTTANCILTVCLNCRKPYVFITYVLNNLLDLIVPVQESQTSSLILGILGCLKVILPHIRNTERDQEIRGSFGIRKEINESPLAVDRLLQVYELCLYFMTNRDHNIVNASLETLNILLQNSPGELKSILLSPDGINKSRISSNETNKFKLRSPSVLSVATTQTAEENLLAESELVESLRPDIEKWIDDSKLSVMNITFARTSNLVEKEVPETAQSSAQSSFESFDYTDITLRKTDDFVITSRSDSVIDNMDRLALSENSSEKSSSLLESGDINLQDVDVGDFQDKDIPLIYCARLISKCFLLTGTPGSTYSDKTVRVSVKSLALSCLSTILHLYPHVFLKYLDKNHVKDLLAKNDDKCLLKQQISDVLLFDDHVDPQLRGAVKDLIANFIKAVIVDSCGYYQEWIMKNSEVDHVDVFDIRQLIKIIIKGLEDESSNSTRQSLISLQVCFKVVVESQNSSCLLPVLQVLPLIAKNPYWLVKVKLVEVISKIQYINIHYVVGNWMFQDKIIYNVLFELLDDEDQRVRTACSNAIVRIIPNLYFEQFNNKETTVTCKALYYKNLYLSNLKDSKIGTNLNSKRFINNMPFPFDRIEETACDQTEYSLSSIISTLYKCLLTSTSKHLLYGCIETLCLLSEAYPTTVYSKAWSCCKIMEAPKERPVLQRSNSQSMNPVVEEIRGGFISSSADLFNVCVHLLNNSIIVYNLTCLTNLLALTGNIFSGISLKNFKPETELNLENCDQLWDMFSDKIHSDLVEQFLVHVVRLLNIFHHILDEIVPMLPQNKPVLANLPTASSLSPIKRRKSDLDKSKLITPTKLNEKEERSEKWNENARVNMMGYFANIPHYMKIYEGLRTAYINYKITLDSEACQKFLHLLETTLKTLSQILELGTLVESGRIAKEILFYLSSTFTIEPTCTVQCVQQLLKCLFATNLTANISEVLTNGALDRDADDGEFGFYHHISQTPYKDISKCIKALHNVNKLDCDGDSTVMGYLHRREAKKVINVSRSSDKILANYIRIFEPMVIKSLKQYTVTSNVKLQCRVLELLSQLVQLRVNYCLLDSEQIFISFVLKQFEFIEQGQIQFANELVPKIFTFLVHLSYGKQHSKSIISVPKIIQLCDGLMASGQSPITHCIPALEPIVEDIFLVRNKSNTPDFKELETTREVLLSMLLRLLEYSEVIDLVVLILNESKYCIDNTDKWLRWSKQVVEVFLPMLKQNKIRLDSARALTSVKRLVFILNPSVFKPINTVLVMLFQDPPFRDDSTTLVNRWLGKNLVLLLIISQVKEEILILKIMESQDEFAPRSIYQNITTTADPLNVTNTSEFFNAISPEVIFVRYLFRVVNIVVEKCTELVKNEEESFLIEQFSSFLMFCVYIFQSGSHCKIANKAIEVINDSSDINKCDKVPLEDINGHFFNLSMFYPTLTFEWCYFLTLLNYKDRNFWSKIVRFEDKNGDSSRDSINFEIVSVGGNIVYCDYLSENIIEHEEQLLWLLKNNIRLLIDLCEELPVCELLSSVHRESRWSSFVIRAIADKCIDCSDPIFNLKILKCIENVHPSQTGALISLLLPNALNSQQLSLTRQVASLASRKIELLLTMSMEEVNNQLSKEDLLQIIKYLVASNLSKKHETLMSLLNKLAVQFYDLNPLELDQRRSVNPEYIKKLQINKSWYLSQVKARCFSSNIGPDVAEMLNTPDYTELADVMSCQDFNKLILKDCILWSINVIRRHDLREEPCLLKATIDCLLKNINTINNMIPNHQVYQPYGRDETDAEKLYSNLLTNLFKDRTFFCFLQNIIPSVTLYIKSLSQFPFVKIPDANFEAMMRFAVICLESVNYFISENDTNLNVNFIDCAVNCADVILKQSVLCDILALDVNLTWLCSAVNSVYKLVDYLLLNDRPLVSLPKYCLKSTLESAKSISAGQACYQLSVLIVWLQKSTAVNIPKFLFSSIKSITVSLSRLPLVKSYILIPPSAWKNGWTTELCGNFNTQAPPLPIEFLQEIEILEEFIFRVTLLGWTSRQQFEETWMCLLSVLSLTPSEESTHDEINYVMQAMSLAVQAITSLLLQTLYYPQPGNQNVSKLIHVPRDSIIEDKTASMKKLKMVHRNMQNKYNECVSSSAADGTVTNVFEKSNFEKIDRLYSYGQVSVEYLIISAEIVEINDANNYAYKMYEKRRKVLEDYGLDVNSCLQFLLDLYSQWIKPQAVSSLRLLYEVVRSIVMISDLFTEKAQFSWMLDTCMELSKTHTAEDEILHQYLVIGICKAAATLSPDIEVYEAIKKLLVQYLKSSFLPARIASVHGLLYILQGCLLCNTVIGGISDEMQLLLPIAVEYVQCNINLSSGILRNSQEHTLLVWALAFFLIENVDESHMESNFVFNTLQTVLMISSQNNLPIPVHSRILKGLERTLLVKRNLQEKLKKQIVKLALEKIKCANPSLSLSGVQLLLTYMYVEYFEHSGNTESSKVQSNPDHLVQTIEKVSAIFDRIKKGYAFEVEVLCTVLPNILNDFFTPSDILTKVIGEFLSPQQPHPKLLSRVVFQVFETAIEQSQLSLLQDWVVFSLSNFTQSFSIGMATWCLTCFFISASSNQWLRSFFPYVQSRIGRYEYEDRKMLCIAGADFYKNLTTDKQKQTFVHNFREVKAQTDMPFSDLLASL